MRIHSITLEAPSAHEAVTAQHFYDEAFALDGRISARATTSPSSGFRGFAPSLIVEQPDDVDALVGRALESGAEVLKPVAKSLWGYGGSLRTPEGTVWQIASANKKNTGQATGKVERLVLLLGVTDVNASKRFYEERGLAVAKSYGSKYVEFDSGAIALALYKRQGLAKQVGVADAAGTGSHRVAVNADHTFDDPDGYAWEAIVAP